MRRAVGVYDGYAAMARALLLFSGAKPVLPDGASLRALVSRLSVENDDIARRTIAQILLAIADALSPLGVDSGDLRKRAERLTHAAPLDYASTLRDALEPAVAALRSYRSDTPAFAALASDAHVAVERIERDRPFELQRSAAQDALRLITDALTVASERRSSVP